MREWRVGEVYRCPGLGQWRVLTVTTGAVVAGVRVPGPVVTFENAALGYVMVMRLDDPDLEKLERIDG